MKLSGYLLLAVAAACLATVHPLPTEHKESATDTAEEGALPSSGWGLASLDALAQQIKNWVAPVVRAIEGVVKNKTVTEVVVDAQDATVQLATRVSQSEAVQGAKEAISPLTRLFDRVHDRVKDKTLQQLAGDVERQLQRLDQTVAEFIRGLGDDQEDQKIVEQILPAPEVQEAPEVDPEQEAVAAAAEEALDQEQEEAEAAAAEALDQEQEAAEAAAAAAAEALDKASEAENEVEP